MEIVTVWGVTWRIPSTLEIILISAVIILIVLFFVLLRYNQVLRKRDLHEHQLFLFKAKHLGLSSYQFKILEGITHNVHLKEPSKIFTASQLYEQAIGSFLSYIIESSDENESSFTCAATCRDIVITYEKIYNHVQYRPPLESLHDIEINQLLNFTTGTGHTFIGKILEKKDISIRVKLFRNKKHLYSLNTGSGIEAFFWRPGDAEYTFKSTILDVSDDMVDIEIPETISRGEDIHLPYIDVIIPCTISYKDPTKASEGVVKMQASIFKLNEEEVVLRTTHKLSYYNMYALYFTISEFAVKSNAQLLSDRTIQEKNIYYYTFKLNNLTQAAHNIIKTFIHEHL